MKISGNIIFLTQITQLIIPVLTLPIIEWISSCCFLIQTSVAKYYLFSFFLMANFSRRRIPSNIRFFFFFMSLEKTSIWDGRNRLRTCLTFWEFLKISENTRWAISIIAPYPQIKLFEETFLSISVKWITNNQNLNHWNLICRVENSTQTFWSKVYLVTRYFCDGNFLEKLIISFF